MKGISGLGPSRAAGWAKRLAQVTLMCALAWTVRCLQQPVPSFSVWDFQDPVLVLGRLQIAAGHYALQGVQFCLLGALLPLTLRRGSIVERLADSQAAGAAPTRWRRACRFLTVIVAHALAAILVFFAVAAVAAAVSMLLVDAVGTAAACDVGLAVLGIKCRDLDRLVLASRLERSRKAVDPDRLGCFVGSGRRLVVAGQVLQAQPQDFEPLQVTSADKRELVELVKRQREIQDGHEVYHLTADQVDKLLAWGVAVASAESKVRIELSDDGQLFWASLRLPARVDASRPFLNLIAAGRCEISDERVELNVQSAQIGSLIIPGTVTRFVSEHLARWINDDPLNRDLLLGVSAVMTHEDGADLYVTIDGIRHRRLAKALRNIGARPDVTDVVAAHLSVFAAIAKKADRRDPLFDVVVRQAFETAAARSQAGDPVKENRAAILALGVALGTVSLDKYVGGMSERNTRGYVAVIPSRSRLRGRADWSRHFWVSAAVTLLATNHVSDALGLLKEELDAGRGGSGFSFGDLAADRAGTTFAQVATRDADSARAIQRWILAVDTDLNELMPAAADLPEGMSDADMLNRFDAVGGPRYQQMIEEIERRLRELPWRT